MTIKEAFQKLANDLSASLRNPFFVGRTLHDDFADIADKIVDAGGSTVTVTPVVTEGTKIATITVDGTGKDLYAPETEVMQVVTEGTKIATINETDIYAPSNGGGSDWTFLGSKKGSGNIALPSTFNEILCCVTTSGTISDSNHKTLSVIIPSAQTGDVNFTIGLPIIPSTSGVSISGSLLYSHDSSNNSIGLNSVYSNGTSIISDATLYIYYR